MGERLGEALLELRTDDKAYTRGVTGAERQAQGLGRRLDDTSRRASAMGKALGVAAAAGAAALTVLVGKAINQADAMSKAAQRTGVATEALSRLAWAGDLSDVSLGTLTGSLARLSNQMGQVASGQGRDLEAIFAAIGVSVTDTEGRLRSADAVLMDVAETFSTMEDGADKTALAIRLFGRSGADLIPLLNNGRKGLAEMGAEADRLGLTISTQMGRRAEAFNDAMTRVKAAFQGVVLEIADHVLPHLEQFAEKLTDPQVLADVKTIGSGIVTVMGWVASAIRGVISLWNTLGDWLDWAANHDLFGRPMERPAPAQPAPKPLAEEEFDTRFGGLPGKTERLAPAPRKPAPRTGPSLSEMLAAGAAADRLKAQAEELEMLRKEIVLVGQSDQARARAIATLQAEQEVRRLGLAAGGDEAKQLVANAQALADYAVQLEKAAAAHQVLTAQAESIEMLRLELTLVGQTEAARARAIAALQAEQEIRRIGLDLTSEKAKQIRARALVEAELTSALEKSADAWGTFKNAGERAIDDLVTKLRKGDLDGALEALGDNVANTLAEMAIANPLKNALLGTNYGTIDQLGGILGRLFGGGEDLAAGALAQTVGTMSVQAAVVNIAGGEGLARMFAPANGNTPAGTVTRAPLADVAGPAGTVAGNGVREQIWNFFAGKGLAPHQIAGIVGHAGAESSFNPLAVGDGGTSFGLFQHHKDRAAGLLDHVGGKGNLGDVQKQLEYTWKELQGPESAALKKLMASTDVRGATQAWGQFERPQGWSAQNPEGMHNWTGRLAGAEKAMADFAAKTSEATLDLAQLGGGLVDASGGLDTLAQGLTSALGSGGEGAGGLLGLLKGLFSGFFASGGLIPSGTFGIVGERGPEPVIGTSRGAMVLPNSSLTAAAGRREKGNVVAVQPVVHNYAPVDVSGGEEDDGQGGTRPTLVIEERMAAGITRRGSAVRGSLESTYGLRPRRRRL